MQIMATERDKMRAARLAEIAKKDGQGRLRTAPKGFMQEIVDRFNLRSVFDSEEVRDKLKMAGLRGQAPLVDLHVFPRGDADHHVAARAVLSVRDRRLRLSARWSRSALRWARAFVGFYVPNMFIQNLMQRRQTSIKNAFPDALDMLLICVQSGMSVEAAFGKVANEVGSQSLELAEELSLTTAELSYLQDRRQAYENLGKRTGIPGVKAVATALIQAERYGTPVGTGAARDGQGEPRHAHGGGREEGRRPAAEADRADDHLLPAGAVRRDPGPGPDPGLQIN